MVVLKIETKSANHICFEQFYVFYLKYLNLEWFILNHLIVTKPFNYSESQLLRFSNNDLEYEKPLIFLKIIN